MDSLQNQSFQNFELIFVDYGSDSEVSDKVKALCARFDFCQYVFCDSRGMVWNRAHALNIGIRNASGEYFLSADVDLIYGQEVLTNLSAHCSSQVQIFNKAFLLPRKFSGYQRLSQLRGLNKTDENTIGLFHCVALDHIREIGGYDQYYRIWGFEDKDLRERLDLECLWLNSRDCPVFHQWHPKGSSHEMMPWLWQDMTIHYALPEQKGSTEESWGELILSSQRPLNQVRENRIFHGELAHNQFARRTTMRDIVRSVTLHPELETKLILKKPHTKTTRWRSMTLLPGTIYALIVHAVSPGKTSNRLFSENEASEAYWYFLYTLIFKSGLVRDYRIVDSSDFYTISLLGHYLHE
jgi:glycosyltransferase involved in cell wall biosynthesis